MSRPPRLVVALAASLAVGAAACATSCGARNPQTDASDDERAATAPSSPPRAADPADGVVSFSVSMREAGLAPAGFVPPRWRMPVLTRPIAHARVLFVDDADQLWVGEGVTDAEGRLSVPPDTRARATRAIVLAEVDAGATVRVTDCANGRCASGGLVYAWAVDASALADGVVEVPIDSAVAGAFGIAVEIEQALSRASEVGFGPFEPLDLRWRAGEDTACRTSCFDNDRGRNVIYVLSVPSDTDEYDQDILRHELGHYLEHLVGASTHRGGYHDGTPMAPGHAWSEGGCTWMAIALANDPVYVDTGLTGGGWYDYASPAEWTAGRALAADQSEDFVAEILWALAEQLGEQPVFAAWRGAATAVDRGARGTDLTDVLDVLACADPSFAQAAVASAATRGWQYAAPDAHGCAAIAARSPTAPSVAQSPITPARIALDRGAGALAATIELRATTDEAEIALLAGGVDDARVVATESIPVAALRAGRWVWRPQVPVGVDDDLLSVTLRYRLSGGAQYAMSASAEPGGVIPSTVPVDDTRTEKLPGGVVLRVAGATAATR